LTEVTNNSVPVLLGDKLFRDNSTSTLVALAGLITCLW